MKKISSQERAAPINLASSLPPGSDERKAILAGLSQTAAVKPADLEALKKVEAEEGMDPKAIGLSVSKIVVLEKLGLVHYDRGDGSVLVTNEGKKLLKGKTATVRAEEPYQGVMGIPYARNLKPDVLKVKTEKELLQLSYLLDKLYDKSDHGRIVVPITPGESKALQKWGVNPETFSQGFGNYTLSVLDAKGVEYDALDDLGIGG